MHNASSPIPHFFSQTENEIMIRSNKIRSILGYQWRTKLRTIKVDCPRFGTIYFTGAPPIRGLSYPCASVINVISSQGSNYCYHVHLNCRGPSYTLVETEIRSRDLEPGVSLSEQLIRANHKSQNAIENWQKRPCMCQQIDPFASQMWLGFGGYCVRACAWVSIHVDKDGCHWMESMNPCNRHRACLKVLESAVAWA